ncbi:transmembrane and TPR repeat-containing protein 3-like, partial [Diaphorina citri]|uniref:Transmembrane and TPR repeat-containing protein 3-like n=1 Tax=Diaphorina citri TaxID=121845 RepID=A0A3Q0JB45_DIACI
YFLHREFKRLITVGMTVLLLSHGLKTWHRNWDWQDEYSIFMAGLKVNSRNENNNDRVLFNLGMLATDEANITEAERWFKQAVEFNPTFRSALFNLALLLADDNRPLEAVPFLNQLIRIHPDHVKGLILLGDIYINVMNDLDAADNCYNRILELEPDNIQAMHNLCVVLVERDQLIKAESCLKRVHLLSPDEDYILRHLNIVQARLARLKQQQNSGGAVSSDAAGSTAQNSHKETSTKDKAKISPDPSDVNSHHKTRTHDTTLASCVGRTYNHLKLYGKAEEAYLRAKSLLPKAKPGESYQTRIAPNHLNVFLNLANLIAKNSTRLEEADLLYRQAISMRADYTQAYINRGDVLLKLNRTKEAQEVYERALFYDSSNPDIYYNLGVVFLEQNKSSQALAYLDKALEFDPDHAQALFNSAIILTELGRPDFRKIARERLLKLLHKVSYSLILLGDIYINVMNDLDAADNCYNRILELEPDNIQAMHNLCVVLVERDQLIKAESCLKRVHLLSPDEDYILRHLNIVQARLARLKQQQNSGGAVSSDAAGSTAQNSHKETSTKDKAKISPDPSDVNSHHKTRTHDTAPKPSSLS